ncbi:MAG: hypothetical protein WAT81_01510 [Candidatus Moraniibacteriota bacterium]
MVNPDRTADDKSEIDETDKPLIEAERQKLFESVKSAITRTS